MILDRILAPTILAVLVLLASPESCQAQQGQPDPNLPSLRIIFFTPADVDPPKNAQERLTQVAKYTENFFVTWMTKWKYEPTRKKIFQWQPDGNVEVLFAKGKQKADFYKDGSFRPRMVQQLAAKHNIPRNGNINWVFVYKGPPPAKYTNYKGAGNSKQGGWAMANYLSTDGEIRIGKDIAEGFHDDFTLKGVIHELGHGFGLPHLGPRLKRDAGNSLMGPITRIWEKFRGPKDRRGYLTEASAAMLWKHPIFSGTSKNRNVMPTLKLAGYRARFDRKSKTINVSGKLDSESTAHSVIVVDDMDNKPGEYWKRAYVSRLKPDGSFNVSVDEPVPSGGKFRIVFCFNNGIVTGTGKGHGLNADIQKPYRYVRQSYVFD